MSGGLHYVEPLSKYGKWDVVELSRVDLENHDARCGPRAGESEVRKVSQVTSRKGGSLSPSSHE